MQFVPSGIVVHKDIVMNNYRMMNLPDPISSREPATKNYVDTRKHIITIWAETNGPIEDNMFEWSFGSGSGGRSQRRNGYTMMAQGRIIRMGMAANSEGNPARSNASVTVVVNGRENTNYYVVVLAGQYAGTTTFDHPLELNEGDRINFRSHTDNPRISCATVCLLIELDV